MRKKAKSQKSARISIGALSGQAGVIVETIRYYERIGILPEPPRTEGGHRAYAYEHLQRLTFIRRCRELGYSLREVRTLLDLVDGGGYTCAEVKAMTLDHAANIRRKIRDLRRMDRVLREMAARCDDGHVPECPIVEALAS